ncbi:serine peptidase [Alsobacter metallidurans]|uniref:Probable periplasmic serine endoprotease DegP-like n=1 Tax=Alsobacter metallidurans TaxID=340221 RepID=A0A917I601_9HYPH|nr:Do family serine endopeptidase [Alsobacter metallidurans]GGH14016.1 serine peptidase [Alsobacter metallidurans]
MTPETPTTSPGNAPKRRLSVRAGLLAGACAIAVVGAGAAHYSDFPTAVANAQTAQPQVAQALGGPPSFANAVDRVKPAVVSVKVKVENAATRDGDIAGNDDEDGGMPQNIPPQLRDFFRQFGQPDGRGMPRGGQARPRGHQYGQAQGSGFFITPDGYIVTNNHVVANAVEVAVTMDDGRTLDAKVIGTDPKTDLALLKVKQSGTYPFVKFAKGQPRVGDWVIAVGNPFGLGGTVTAGIVSARGRDIGSGPYDDYLQIDAAVNRGNSGGPTFDMNGDVVGVNTAIYSPSGGNVGIAFAIPTEVATNVIESLKDTGSVSRGFIGVQIQPVTSEIADSLGLKETRGALVADAQSNGPAAAAGVKAGDVIVSVDGDKIAGPKELSRRIGSMKPGDKAELSVVRDGREQQITLKLAALPNEKQARADTQDDAAPTAGGFGLSLAPARTVQGAGGQGVVVTQVDPDGPGAQQGVKQGDVILEIGGRTVSDPTEVKQALADARQNGKKAVLIRLKTGKDSRFVALAFPKKDARG